MIALTTQDIHVAWIILGAVFIVCGFGVTQVVRWLAVEFIDERTARKAVHIVTSPRPSQVRYSPAMELDVEQAVALGRHTSDALSRIAPVVPLPVSVSNVVPIQRSGVER